MKSFRDYLQEKSVMTKDKTLEFIKKAHAGQKYGTDPYWTHPKAVADVGKKFFGSKFDEVAYMAALLHDVIEDTPYNEKQLKELGFPDDVIAAVKLLTKDKSLTYKDNIKKIINSGNHTAMMVKYSDNYVNFTGDKSGWSPEKREKSQEKYKNSINTIGSKLGVRTKLSESMSKRYIDSMNMLGEVLDMKCDWSLDDEYFT